MKKRVYASMYLHYIGAKLETLMNRKSAFITRKVKDIILVSILLLAAAIFCAVRVLMRTGKYLNQLQSRASLGIKSKIKVKKMKTLVIISILFLSLTAGCVMTKTDIPDQDYVIFTPYGQPIIIEQGFFNDCSEIMTLKEYEAMYEEYRKQMLEQYKKEGKVF